MSVIPFPAHRVVERDVHGGLFQDVEAAIQEAADYLESKAGRDEAGTASTAGLIHLSRSRLTIRLLEIAGLMNVARAWTRGDMSTAECRRRAQRFKRYQPTAPDARIPERLRELHEAADRLAERVADAQARLLAACNSSDAKAAP